MLNCNDNANKLKGRFDDSPLHRLCHKSSITLEQLKDYFDGNSNNNNNNDEGVDGWGCTALHVLAGNLKATSEMLEFVSKECATIVGEVDTNGRTFLHYACENYIAFPVSWNLLHSKDSSGSYIIAKEDKFHDNVTTLANRCSYDTFSGSNKMMVFALNPLIRDAGRNEDEMNSMDNLIEKRIDYKTKDDNFQKYSELDTHGLVSYIYNLKDEQRIEKWVDKLENATVESVKLISEFTDLNGRTMLSVAPLQIRNLIEDKILFLGKFKLADIPLIYQSDTALVLEARNFKAKEYYSNLYDEYEDKDSKCITEKKFGQFMGDMLDNKSEEQHIEDFKKYDSDKDGKISKHEFLRVCEIHLGKQYSVALKLMKNHSNYEREKQTRDEISKNSNNSTFIKILDSYDKSHQLFMNNKNDFLSDFGNIDQFDQMLVMPLGHRNLDTIIRCEKPDDGQMKSFAIDIVESIKELHDKSMIHGDIKPQNFVRIKNKIRMIDLDASCKITEDNHFESISHAGLKFSSGIVPPEMIHKMNETEKNKYLEYFQHLKIDDIHLWEKVKPKYHEDEECYYCVKTFLEGEKGTIKDIDKLLYEPIKADVSFDLWSLGVILYTLLSGKSLFDTDENEDMTSFEGFQKLSNWNDKTRDKALRYVNDERAQDLLRLLLSKDPNERNCMEFVLNAYIKGYKSIAEDLNKYSEKHFHINGEYLLLPESGNISKEVAQACGELVLYVAQNGIGEKVAAKGMLIVLGAKEDYESIGFRKQQDINRFDAQEIFIQNWEKHETSIKSCFTQDGAVFVDGKSGKMLADHYIINLSTRDVDHGGGTGHMNASAAGKKECLAIKCSEDSCCTDGYGKGKLKLFLGKKEPTYVHVRPHKLNTSNEN